MMNDPNEKKLIADLLAGSDDLREATLTRGLTGMRRRRSRQRVIRAGAFAGAIVAILSMILVSKDQRSTAPGRRNQPETTSVRPVNVIAGTEIRVLSDQELLDLFPNRPVALVGPAGKQKLILFDAMNN